MADWPTVLEAARAIVAEQGLMPRPELWRTLLERGLVPPTGANGFRAAVAGAQLRGDFPTLPRGKSGPQKGEQKRHHEGPKVNGGTLSLRRDRRGVEWWWGRYFAGGTGGVELRDALGLGPSEPGGLTREQAWRRMQERRVMPTPYELRTSREAECLALLAKLVGVVTVKLSPHAFAILAAQGYGDLMVRAAVHKLVNAGLAELRWERAGLDRVPCVKAAC